MHNEGLSGAWEVSSLRLERYNMLSFDRGRSVRRSPGNARGNQPWRTLQPTLSLKRNSLSLSIRSLPQPNVPWPYLFRRLLCRDLGRNDQRQSSQCTSSLGKSQQVGMLKNQQRPSARHPKRNIIDRHFFPRVSQPMSPRNSCSMRLASLACLGFLSTAPLARGKDRGARWGGFAAFSC